jgi:predicted esterase
MKRIFRLASVLATAFLLAGCPWDSDSGAGGAPAADTTPPTAPTALNAATVSDSGIDLDWTAATDDTGVTGYLIERCQGPGCSSYAQVAAVPAGSTSYSDTGLKGSARYGYRVRATDQSGNVGNPASANARTGDLLAGLKTMVSGGGNREYYLDLPTDYDADAPPKPLIIAYHGTGGSYQAWFDYYRLRETVGDGAILIYPDALPNGAGTKQWDFARDFQMFEDLLARLPSNVTYDTNRIFVTGHSSGGGLSHEIGCRYGNRIRGIAPVAGGLTTSTCVGSVAVLQIQGQKDSLVPVDIARLARRFWVLYNGFAVNTSRPGVLPQCIDSVPEGVSSDYPVEWCLHQEGEGVTAHAWPSFANQAIWDFFQGLSSIPPRDAAPDGGGNAKALGTADTTLSFTLVFPDGIAMPLKGAAVLYEAGTRQPIGNAPLAFLNLNFAPSAAAGDQRSYQIPIQYPDNVTFPGEYTLDIAIYVEGGSFPIPASGVDQTALIDVALTDRSTPVVIPTPLILEPVETTF